VGFPTETPADFRRLKGFVAEGWFDHVGVFAYSHEDNIKSAKFGDPIPARTKRRRRQALMAAQQAVAQRRNDARVGQVLPVLVQGYAEETALLLQGRAAFQGPEVDGVVYINEGTAAAGGFHAVEITEAHVYDLVGRIVEAGNGNSPSADCAD
jgi:ribosomal protein S12 methylthiotransferase